MEKKKWLLKETKDRTANGLLSAKTDCEVFVTLDEICASVKMFYETKERKL